MENNNKNMITNPLTKTTNIKLIESISANSIIKNYQEQLQISVKDYFQGLKTIKLYECHDTGYKFFYPPKIMGDEKFYEKLSKFPWYYMNWKWEHDIVNNIINKENKILEIGCAKGGFLEKIKLRNKQVVGLEFNKKAIKNCRQRGLNVFNQTIQEHSKNNKNCYDIVCSFQVAEHIPNINEFIQSSIDCLKPGGKLIISVPNNDTEMLDNSALNTPPHHINLFNINSLIKIQNYFNIKVDSFYIEPLQKYHTGFYRKEIKTKLSQKLKKKFKVFSPLLQPFANRIADFVIRSLSKHIIGHTILFIYTKE
ncbi:MAG: class I SAM-dependent methyltransferase [Candidatus Pacebacteria bacterium]|nr:class I SAM-dependent methyltransferase [Candidatus Paceibacterota bacterium]